MKNKKNISLYDKIENFVVGGYKKIENGAVSGMNRFNDRMIGLLFARKGESVKAAKKRLLSGKFR